MVPPFVTWSKFTVHPQRHKSFRPPTTRFYGAALFRKPYPVRTTVGSDSRPCARHVDRNRLHRLQRGKSAPKRQPPASKKKGDTMKIVDTRDESREQSSVALNLGGTAFGLPVASSGAFMARAPTPRSPSTRCLPFRTRQRHNRNCSQWGKYVRGRRYQASSPTLAGPRCLLLPERLGKICSSLGAKSGLTSGWSDD